MAETTPNPAEQPDRPVDPVPPSSPNEPGAAPAAPPPRKRRRRWPWVLVSVMVLLGLLVLFAPAIASTGWVRNIVLGRINANLNGQVKVDGWDLNWRGGTEVRNLQVFQEGAQILQIQRLSTQLSLWGVLRGNYFTYGKTKVDGLSFTLVKYEDGSTNFDRLLKPQTTTAPPPVPTKPGPAQPALLPELSGDFDVDFWGTIDDRQLKRTVTIDRSRAQATVTDINAAIAHQLDLNVRVDGKAPGKLVASGSIDAVENRQVLPAERMKADEDVRVQNLDLAGVAGFVDLSGAIKQLEGVSNGTFSIEASGSDQLVIAGDFTTEKLAVGGPALKGDTYKTPRLAMSVPETTVDAASGRLRVGSGSPGEQLTLKVEEGTLALAADASIESLKRVFAGQAPGAPGQLTLTADFDLKQLADDLPRTMGLVDGVKITSGTLHNVTTVTFRPDRALFEQKLDVTELTGVNDGKPVTAQPIHLTAAGASLGGAGPIPELRDFALVLKSGFATVNGNAPTIANLKVTGNVDLAAAQREIGQFYAMGKSALDGSVSFTATTEGDLTQKGGTANANLSVVGSKVRVENVAGKTVNQPYLDLSLAGQLVRGENAFIEAIRQAVLTLKTGDAVNPTVDTRALGEVAVVTRPQTSEQRFTVPQFTLERMNVNLPKAQAEFGAFVPALQQKGLAFANGVVSVSAAGGYDGAATTLTALTAKLDGVTLDRRLDPEKVIHALDDYTGTVDLQGRIVAAGSRLDARLAKLAFTDPKNRLVNLSKVGEGDFVATLAGDGRFTLDGKLEVNANLKAIDDLLLALGEDPAEVLENAGNEAGRLESGMLAGTLAATSGPPGTTDLAGDLTVDKLTVRTQREPIRNQQVKLSWRSNAAHDLSRVAASQVNINSSFATVNVADVELRPKAGSPFDLVQRGKVTLNVPDAPAAWAVLAAFGPKAAPSTAGAEAPPAGGAPAGVIAGKGKRAKGPPAIAFRSGSFSGLVQVSRAQEGLKLEVEHFDGRNLSVGRGDNQFTAAQVNLAMAAVLVPDTKDPAKPLLAQVREIQVPKLDGDLAVGRVTLNEPIVIRDPAGTMGVQGAVTIDGELRTVGQLADALATAPDAGADRYAGRYTLTQRFSTQGKTITASGKIDVANFAVTPPAGAAAGATPKREDRQEATSTLADLGKAVIGQGSRRAAAENGDRNRDPGSQRVGRPRRAAPGAAPRAELVEDQLAFTNDLVFDQQAQTLSIRKLDLLMRRTNALALSMSGTVTETATVRNIKDAKVKYSYDLAALSRFLAPMLPAESRQQFEALQLRGVAKNHPLAISGSYPVATTPGDGRAPAREADPLRNLKASTNLLVEYVNYDGMELDKPAEIPVALNDGKLRIARQGKGGALQPEVLEFSGGKVDVGGLEINLLSQHPTVSATRDNYKLVDGVKIGPEFFEAYLADLHPLFSVPDKSRAVATITVSDLTRLPIDRSIMRDSKRNDGRGQFTMSLTDLSLDSQFGGMMQFLAEQLKLKPNEDGTISGNIRDAKIVIENGRVTSDLQLDLAGQTIGYRNAIIDLSSRQITAMTMTVPKEMLPLVREQKFLQPIIQVPVSGSLTAPKFDIIQAALRTAIPENPLDLLNNLEDVIGRKEGSGRSNATPDGARNGGQDGRQDRSSTPRRNQRDDTPRDRSREDAPPAGTIGRPAPRE